MTTKQSVSTTKDTLLTNTNSGGNITSRKHAFSNRHDIKNGILRIEVPKKTQNWVYSEAKRKGLTTSKFTAYLIELWMERFRKTGSYEA